MSKVTPEMGFFTIRGCILHLVMITFSLVLPFSVNAISPKFSDSGRVNINFNTGWFFSDSLSGDGSAKNLNDSLFVPVTFPHTIAVVTHSSIDTSDYNRITWYRKHFVLPDIYHGRRITIEFQAVSKSAEVFCNGQHVGGHKGAYTPFTVDITDNVSFDSDNVIAVQVDSRQNKDIPPEGLNVDYMIGGGIVRDVSLVITNQVHINWIYARRDTTNTSSINVTAEIANAGSSGSSGTMQLILVDADNKVTATGDIPYTLAPGAMQNMQITIGPVNNLKLWNPDSPYLYTLHMKLWSTTGSLDNYKQWIGIRSVEFGKNDGVFRINGLPIKLRGLNRHETFPFIGRAASNRLQRKDADILKYDFGCNIVRCSHYPQDPEFLERCDEIGLMVLEEMPGWCFVNTKPQWQKTALDNLTEMVIRDRNHPSVISFGVRVNQSADFHKFYMSTNQIAHTLAPDRPTHGVRVLDRGSKTEFLEDIWTQNFAIPTGTPPVLPWITTESVGHRFPAHSWDNDSHLVGQMLAHAAVLDSACRNPQITGLLGWCAFDYNSPYHYAENSVCYHGVADMFRIPKHAAYFYRSQAEASLCGPMVYIAHYWEKFTGTNDIWVASNCDSVEVFVNNRSIGKHTGSEYRALSHPLFVWRNIHFAAGEIKAVGFIDGRVAATFMRRTPGKPVDLKIAPDDSVLFSGGDMTRVVVSVIDARGQVVPHNNAKVRIAVEGPADFLGESPITLENGMTAFYIKTRSGETGTINCSVTGDRLTDAKASIVVRDDNGN